MKVRYTKPTTCEVVFSLRRAMLVPSTLIISDETVDEGLVKEERQEGGSSWDDIWEKN